MDKKIRNAVLTKEVIPIEEKPNKPKEKMIVKGMQGPSHPGETTYLSQKSAGMGKQELKNST